MSSCNSSNTDSSGNISSRGVLPAEARAVAITSNMIAFMEAAATTVADIKVHTIEQTMRSPIETSDSVIRVMF